MTWKLILLGTPDFGVPAFEKVAADPHYEIVGVITQPDKPAGRGQILTPPPVKEFARSRGIPVLQPSTFRGVHRHDGLFVTENPLLAEFVEFLNTAYPVDGLIVIAYGKLIPDSLLGFAPIVNVHASLLPRWRGASPMQWTIFSGDTETGVCLMGIESGLDTGPVYATAKLPLGGSENFGTLYHTLSQLGADLLAENLPRILRGDLLPSSQSVDGVTHAEKWTKASSQIRWSDPGAVTERRIRASSPVPGAHTRYGGEIFKIYSAHLVRESSLSSVSPGTIVESNSTECIVATGSKDYIALDEIQFPGKRRLPIREALHGRAISAGHAFE